MNRSDLRAALSNPNVIAFLRVIREGESSQAPIAYRMRFGGHGKPPAYFDDLSAHPRIMEPTRDGNKSSAAGAYQATWTTWREENDRYHWPDFSEESQDEFAIARIAYRGALEAVMAGRFGEACHRCRAEWTSLPGGAEENAATKRAAETYLKWGGRLEGEAPNEAPIIPENIPAGGQAFDPDSLATEHYDGTEPNRYTPQTKETHMAFPLIPLITAFGPQLLQLIPQLGALFGSGSDVQVRNVQAATMAVDAIVKATDSPNLQAAIERMQDDPEVAKAARGAVAEVMALVEVGGGIVEARKAAYSPEQVEWWKNPAVIVAIGVLPLVYMVVSAVVFGVGGQAWSDDVKTLTVTAILSGALGSITGFFLGSSLGSQRKTEMRG